MRAGRVRGPGGWSVAVWILPCTLYASDASAWGLYTHVYFSQVLIWAVPLADPRFRRALRHFPELCLAGTCLPDISLFSRPMRSPLLAKTHQWTRTVAMLQTVSSDEERAMALGYAAHLLTDIVAHNYFVPAHERMWLSAPLVTHAGAEWAMDAHLSRQLFMRPDALITRHHTALVAFAHGRLGLESRSVSRAISVLKTGEALLRKSRLPELIYAAARCGDHAVRPRFDEYVTATASRLRQVNRLIAGETPAWLPEPDSGESGRSTHDPEAPGPFTLLLPPDWFRDASSR